MKIAVTHLTRMQQGYFCVAGVDIETGRHVRPVVPNARLRDQFCARRGGPFDMATVVDLGAVRPVPLPPELEDHEFTPRAARVVRQVEPTLFWEMLCFLAKPSLHDLFGPELRGAGRESAIVSEGTGSASLGCLAPMGRPRLALEERPGRNPSIRLHDSDGALSLDLSVTDLRLWEEDHATPRYDLLQVVGERLDRGTPCLLSVGLTRPYASRDGQPPVHWLQVNNIHPSDDPCWRLANTQSVPAPQWSRKIFGDMPSRPMYTSRPNDDLDDLPF